MQTEFIFSDKWCEIVFEKRNHAYGAYVLRKNQPGNLIAGGISTFLVFAGLFSGFIYLNNNAVEKIKQKVFPKTPPITQYNFDQTKPPIQPAKQIEQPKNTGKATGLFVASDSTTADKDTANTSTTVMSTNGTSGKTDTLTADVSGGGSPAGGGKDKTELYLIPAVMPEFPGGENAMLAFMRRNMSFPDEYLRMGKSATVYIQFVIDTTGKVTEIVTLKGEKGYPLFEEAAMEAAGKMPRWKPGEQGGMKVPVLYKLPVSFSSK